MAPARSSSSNTLVAAGPATISSRNGRSVRKTSTTSLWTPADIRSSTSPLVLRAAPPDEARQVRGELSPAGGARLRHFQTSIAPSEAGLLPQEPLRTSCNARETGLVSGGEHGGCGLSRPCGEGVAGVHVVH